jgi:hypothetical protein
MHQPEETLVEVLTYARSCGYPTSRSQIRRYQQNELIPKPRQVGLGRGRGSETLYPAETGRQLVAARKALKSKSLTRARWRLWWDGWHVQPEIIKADLQRGLRARKWDVNKMPRDMRRRLRNNDLRFREILARLSMKKNAIGTKNEEFDDWVAARAYGFDWSLIKRMRRSRDLAASGLVGFLGVVMQAIAPEAQRVALKNATRADLLVARSELQNILRSVPEFLGSLTRLENPVLAKLGRRAFSAFVEPYPREGPLLLTTWLTIRNYPHVRNIYENLPRMLEILQQRSAATRGS